jgi:hypothetical protein
VKGTRTASTTPADEVATRVRGLGADAEREAFAGGYAQRLVRDVAKGADRNMNPARTVAGAGTEASNRTRILRDLFGARAEPLLRDAAVMDAMRQTNTTVARNSATAERLAEDADVQRKLGGGLALVTGRYMEALRAFLGGTYGKGAEAVADRLLIGATPGERQRLVDYLLALETQQRRVGAGAQRLPLVGVLTGRGAASAAAQPAPRKKEAR